MAEGGRHLSASGDGQPEQPSRRSSERDIDWEDTSWLEEEEAPPRRSRQVRREEMDWQEDEQPRQRQAQPRRQARREDAWQEDERPRQRQTQPRRPVRQEDVDWQEEERPRRQRPPQDAPRQRQQAARQPVRQNGQPQRRPRPQTWEEEEPPRRPRQQAPRQQAPRQQSRQRAYEPQEEPWRDSGRGRSRRQVEVEPPAYEYHRRRGLQKRSIPLILLVIVLVGGVLFAGGKLMSIMLDYRRDRAAYSDLADAVLSGLAEPDATPDPNAPVSGDDDTPQAPAYNLPISVDWDSVRSMNSEIIGWLYSPGTMINYPVMQTSDNDYYLHRGPDRQPNTSGSLFADPASTTGVLHSNFIIYGHNMKDGSMFASIEQYVNVSYYEQHPVMYFLTPEVNYRVDIIAGHIVESTLNNYPGYFSTDADYQNYLNTITSSSFFRTTANVSTQYQLITMSTCDYSGGYADPRFLLHGLLVPV